jgi:hypothetical protein
MTNYCAETDIEKRLGVAIDATTRPSTTELAGMIADADDIINIAAKVSSNLTDTYGALKQIAIDLVMKMINNMWSFTHPEIFPYIDIELSETQLAVIRKTHLKFAGETWDIGG